MPPTIPIAMLVATAFAPAQQVQVIADHQEETRSTGRFEFLRVPRPSASDTATGARFLLVDGERDRNGGELAVLHDGAVPADRDQPSANFFFAAGTDGGRIVVDLHRVIDVARVSTYSWHPGSRGPQVYRLFASDGTAESFVRRPRRGTDPTSCGWTLVTEVDTRPATANPGGRYGVDVRVPGDSLGRHRYLLFDIRRTEADDAFGNTFFSEIDVIDREATTADPEPAPELESGGPVTVPIAGGAFEAILDTSRSEDLAGWAESELIPVVTEWYPRIVGMLPSEGFEAPKRFTITFDEEMRGVAATGGTDIRCASKWFRSNLEGEALGAVLHEMVHVVQQYRRGRRGDPRGGRAPGWLTEGIADYIRWYLFEPGTGGAAIRTERALGRARYDGSYRVTANFLDYVARNHDRDIVEVLNDACRRAAYGDRIWEDRTGETLEQLDALWKASLADALERDAAANQLTDAEIAAGWQLLFNGSDFTGWHGFRRDDVRGGWQVENGTLACVDPHDAGDLVTGGEYEWFELQVDFTIAPGGNSGIMFHVTDEGRAVWATGPEFQLEDNQRAADPIRCGWLYGLYQPPDDPATGAPLDATKPAGEWNHVRLLVTPTICEHEINGVKYFDYVLDSEDFVARVAKSKFGRMPLFAKARSGRIALQGDHGQIRFRNLKIRRIAPAGG